MVANFVAGGAAINVLGAWAGVRVVVVDAGVASPIPVVSADPIRGGRLVRARVRDGTADMTMGPAMTRDEALRAVATGIDLAGELAADGLDLLGVGEMGIGNTTAASAICAVLTGRPVALVTGRGTGIDDATHARKIAAIERAIEVNSPDPRDPIGVLAAVGGLEIALIVGVIVGAAEARIPVVLDGFITGAAALVAASLQPAITPRLIAAHVSIEPGHAVILERLDRRPLLDLDLRLGEGTGAALAMGLIGAAVRLRDGMATFESAAVSGPTKPG
jgi:nicotinate-nucleotide--dimethylbenzimidazole phosphoribosyltransferase